MSAPSPRRGSLLAALCAAASLSVATHDALAQTRDDTRALYQHALDDFGAGQYRPALRAFQRVYELTGDPALLFNIAVTWERLGNPGEAAHTLRRFLIAAPSASNRADVTARIARLEAQERELHAGTPAPAGESTVATSEPAVDNVPAAHGDTAPPGQRGTRPIPSGVSPAPSDPMRVVAPVVTGAGVLAAVAGVIALATANGHIADADAAGDERSRHAAIDAANTQQIAGGVAVGVGIVAAAAGVFFTTRAFSAGREAPRAWLDVQPSSQGAVVAVTWRASWL